MRKSMSTAVKQDESGHNRMLEIGGVQIFSALVCLCWNSQASVYSTSVKNEHHYKKLANKTKKEKKCLCVCVIQSKYLCSFFWIDKCK